jgi:hypothetical protein
MHNKSCSNTSLFIEIVKHHCYIGAAAEVKIKAAGAQLQLKGTIHFFQSFLNRIFLKNKLFLVYLIFLLIIIIIIFFFGIIVVILFSCALFTMALFSSSNSCGQRSPTRRATL